MFVRVKQIVVFHLAIAAAMVVTLIPGFEGHPSELDQVAYQSLINKGSKTRALFWEEENLMETSCGKLADAPKLLTLRFGEDTASTFQSSPPSPVDYAVVLYELNQYGARHIGISDPLFWENDDEDSPMRQLGFASLLQEMSPFKSVLLGAPVDRTMRAEIPTGALAAAAIPSAQINGDRSPLPAANQLPFEFPEQLPAQARLMPTHIDGQPDLVQDARQRLRIPLLMRWGDSIIPSFTLGLVMNLLEVDLHQIEVELGSHIKLSEAHHIAIDEFGCALISLGEESEALQLQASDLLLTEGEDRQPNQDVFDESSLVLILQADQSPGALPTSESQPYEHRGDLLAHAAGFLAANSSTQHKALLSPTPTWIDWLLLGNTALLGAFVYGWGSSRPYGYLILIAGLAGVFCYLSLNAKLWTPTLPPTAAALASLLCVPLLAWWKPAKQADDLPDSASTEADPSRDEPELVELNPDDKK